ncbi:hypothetical protein ACFLUC_03280, partial [Chloroflexota bacterium]
KDRWISIDRAHLRQVPLPPVELFKMGDIYFVKDGNHRVSVARDQGQIFIDAYVTEIDIPVVLTAETKLDDLELKKEYADFLLSTSLTRLRPDANMESTYAGTYKNLYKHIDGHRWYLGEEQEVEISFEDAVVSWYDNIYLPLVEIMRTGGITKKYAKFSEPELYLWVMDYYGYLRGFYRQDVMESQAKGDAARQVHQDYPLPAVRKLISEINRTRLMDEWILNQERARFYGRTRLDVSCLEAKIGATVPGEYDLLLEHIGVHRYYLGENSSADVTLEEAAESWYHQVYLPLVQIIREQTIMDEFPDRTEADLYLWIIRRQYRLQQVFAGDVSLEDAVEDISQEQSETPVTKVVDTIKKATGRK